MPSWPRPMPALRELQRAFAAQVFSGDAAAVLAQVRAGTLAPRESLNIHRNNTFISLREALAAIYPVPQALVGAAFFADLAHGFVTRFPCRSGNLHDFGREMATHAAADPRLAGLPYLGDVARLEWALHEVFHGPDAAALDPDRLRGLAPAELPGLRLLLHPGCRLLRSAFPVLTIWQAHQGPRLPERIDLDAGAEQVLVVRPQLEVEIRRLAPAEFAFLSAVREGAGLEIATESALAVDGNFALQAVLPEYIAGAVFSDLSDQPGPGAHPGC